MALKSHYAVLGVTREADAEIIAAAYRVLAKRYHPDTTDLSPEEATPHFRQVQAAYEILSDPGYRATYDAYLDAEAVKATAERQDREASPNPQEPQRPAGAERQRGPAASRRKAPPETKAKALAWWLFASLAALGVLIAAAWPAARAPVTLFIISLFIGIWRLNSGAEPGTLSKPKTGSRRQLSRSREAAVARGALAALKFSVWGLIGLGLILAAIGAVIAAIEIALGK